MESIQNIKQRFGIIGNNIELQRALERAIQIAPTDISVMVIGESGVGKESIPKIIHRFSPRKHFPYIAVNCGAIPEGTIDSELFGHEKGAFTGAVNDRKGYFEAANKGTIFLDEVGELPMHTQVRLLRVLESGEFIKVGSSQTQTTDVRIVAATNLNMNEALKKGKFREDLYYRLNTLQIDIPALRNRKEDIGLLFRKFSNDFSGKYQSLPIKIEREALLYLENYPWPGNIRQLRNFVEGLSIMESGKELHVEKIKEYLPEIIYSPPSRITNYSNDENLFYELFCSLFDVNKFKKIALKYMRKNDFNSNDENLFHSFLMALEYMRKNNINFKMASSEYDHKSNLDPEPLKLEDKRIQNEFKEKITPFYEKDKQEENIQNIESLSLEEKEIEFIKKALEKHTGKRKLAAQELGISVRTLYRKIKEYNL